MIKFALSSTFRILENVCVFWIADLTAPGWKDFSDEIEGDLYDCFYCYIIKYVKI